MMRAVIYARYSSDNQREASIEDQVRLCRERAEAGGDHVVESTPIVAGTREWWLETLEEWAEEQTEHEANIESLIGWGRRWRRAVSCR